VVSCPDKFVGNVGKYIRQKEYSRFAELGSNRETNEQKLSCRKP
jgi:hypothetical protein